ncbi:PIN domain-containing protein [Myxococcus sp. AB036A]|uniref:PIN domain-containing protein n=1 Tax=Myxococcus sp. AB036A TaxID=2562793 RepID=UPI0011472662|nr:PIN domain-containing protein [Myxococcus sp. AB036A]
MALDKKNPGYNILILDSVYKDPESVFSFQPKTLGEIKSTALIILDTNVLLLPYKTGKDSLGQIKKVYQHLAQEKRLIIPGQVAREFAKNRTERLKDLYQQISRKKLSLTESSYPLLESSENYKTLRKAEASLAPCIAEHTKAIDSLLKELKDWNWDDPVSKIYQDIFKTGIIRDLASADKESIATELEYRQIHSLPPGYKDQSKPDDGVGDLLIWNTILAAGKSHNNDAIFVSADRKSDWWVRTESSALYPRFELVEEYRQATNGKSIHIIDLATLLDMFGATKEAVTEIKNKEATSRAASTANTTATNSKILHQLALAEALRTTKSNHTVIKDWLAARSMPGTKVYVHVPKRADALFMVNEPSSVTRAVAVKYIDGTIPIRGIRDTIKEAEESILDGDVGVGEVVLAFSDIDVLLESESRIKRLTSDSLVQITLGVIIDGEFRRWVDEMYSAP